MGNPPFSAWAAHTRGVGLATFADAAAGAEMVVNATNGAAACRRAAAGGRRATWPARC